MTRKTLTIFLALTLLLCASVGYGQGVQTATLQGTVVTTDGTGLPGVTVTVTSPALLGERQAVTGSNGSYILRGLPPGDYTARFELEGMQTISQKMTLALGLPATADATMRVSAVAEAITVTASAPSVLETTTKGTNITYDTVQQLPVVRTPTGIGSLAAGVTDRTPVGGQLSISGGVAWDNSFLINGVNMQDNIFGNTNNLFIEDAIQETQVLTAGISAEYGHFTGGVLNLITKSGGNTFTGSLRDNITNPDWLSLTPWEQGFRGEGAAPGTKAPHADKMSNVYELTLGGPIMRDRLWFFLAGRDEKSATANNTPVTGYAYTVNQTNRRPEYKLTAALGSNHTIQGDYINNPVNRDNEVQVTPIDTTAIAKNSTRENHGYSAFYQGVITGNLFAEARYSQKIFKFVNLGGTATNIVDSPMRSATRFPGNSAGTFNAPYFDATDPENRNNEQLFASLSYFLSTPRFGSHDIKAGWEEFVDTRTGGNSQSSTGYVFLIGYKVAGGAPALDGNGHLIPVFTPRSVNRTQETRIQRWIPTRGAQLDTTTQSFFINDRWNLGSHWTFNLGIRHEIVQSDATGNITAVDTTNTVPRLAASFDPQANGRYKFDATYAQYAGRYNPAIVGANSSVGSPSSLTGYYNGPAGEGRDFAPGFDPSNYVFYTASVGTLNRLFDENLHSPINEEWTLSGGMALPKGGWAKATFTDRKYKDFIEIFILKEKGCTNISLEGINVGCVDNQFYANTNGPKRHFQSIQFEARYDLTRKWGIEGNWTHQLKNHGNYEGEGGQTIPTSDFGDRPEMQSPRENPEGRLVQQYQQDKLRLWSTYNFDFNRFGNLTTGLIFRYDSPQIFSFNQSVNRSAISAGKDPGYNNEPSTVTIFWGDRGAGEYNATSLFDVSLQYSLPIWKITPWIKVDVRNILNDDTLITYNTTVNPDAASPVDEWGYPTGYTKAATFGRPTGNASYVRPREYLVYAGVRF
jgi:hypothetical protein